MPMFSLNFDKISYTKSARDLPSVEKKLVQLKRAAEEKNLAHPKFLVSIENKGNRLYHTRRHKTI